MALQISIKAKNDVRKSNPWEGFPTGKPVFLLRTIGHYWLLAEKKVISLGGLVSRGRFLENAMLRST